MINKIKRKDLNGYDVFKNNNLNSHNGKKYKKEESVFLEKLKEKIASEENNNVKKLTK